MSDGSGVSGLHAADSAVADALRDLETPLRKFVATLVDNSHEVDDVVQDTMLRLLSAGERMESDSLTAYAFVVARNLVNSEYRRAETARRHAPVLIDRRQPDRPDDAAIANEESRALAEALSALPAPQRDLFLAHEAHEQPLVEVAAQHGTSAGALAAQLGRTRARLRLDYVLAFRRTRLASARCRQVLLALSAGDQRAQERLSAGRHLLTCETCAELSVPLFKRERALAGVVPWLALPTFYDWLKRLLRRPQVQVGTAAVCGGRFGCARRCAMGGRRRDPTPGGHNRAEHDVALPLGPHTPPRKRCSTCDICRSFRAPRPAGAGRPSSGSIRSRRRGVLDRGRPEREGVGPADWPS
jgi:RNA polymerase sigma factor (sigma-70 family)